MAKTKFDLEEQELLKAYESGEFKSDLSTDRREYVAKVAKEKFKKERVNIKDGQPDIKSAPLD